MRRRIALSVVALVLSACGASGDDATNQRVAPDAPIDEAASTSFALVGGGTIDLADYGGQDLALWFWAPW